MLLRTGLIMMAVSVLLAVAVALGVSLRTQAPEMVQSSEAEPLVAKSKAQENENVDFGQKLEIDDEPGDEAHQEDPKPRSEPAPRAEKVAPRVEEVTPRVEDSAP